MNQSIPSQILFLPGATGDPNFWSPVANHVVTPTRKNLVGYPWFGRSRPKPSTGAMEDLVDGIVEEMDRPTALVAQSMGGLLAILATCRRPNQVTHLVLAATSGGIPVRRFGGVDWRPEFKRANPAAPDWLTSFEHEQDLSAEIHSIEAPTLLIWGDADQISPVAVGENLATRFSHSQLRLIRGGGHDFAQVFPQIVAPIIAQHLRRRSDWFQEG